MKIRIIVTLIAISFLIISLPVFAETDVFSTDFNIYTEADTVKIIYKDSKGVTSPILTKGGIFNYSNDNGNTVLSSTLPDNTAITDYYIFPNSLFATNTTKGIIFSYDFMITDGCYMSLAMRAPLQNRDSSLLRIDNGVLTLYSDNALSSDVNDTASVSINVYHKLKIVIDSPSGKYDVYLDGIKVGKTCDLRKNATWIDDKGTPDESDDTGLYYIRMRRSAGAAAEFPSEAYYDNISVKTFQNKGIEVAAEYDIYENHIKTDEISADAFSVSVEFDLFNNSDEEKTIYAGSATYTENTNGFREMTGMKVKKQQINVGINRALVSDFPIPASSPGELSKLMFLNALEEPDIAGIPMKFENDGDSVIISNSELSTSSVDMPAEGISVSNNEREVTVNGYAVDAEGNSLKNMQTSLVVLNLGNTEAEVADEIAAIPDGDTVSYLQTVIYFDEVTTDDAGKYTYKFLMPESAEGGKYLILSKVNGKEYKNELNYVRNADKLFGIKKYNEALGKTLSDLILVTEDEDYSFFISLFNNYTSIPEMYNAVKGKESFYKLVKSFGTYSEAEEDMNNSISQINENLDKSILLSNMEEIDDFDTLKEYAAIHSEKTGVDISGITTKNESVVYSKLAALEEFDSLSKVNDYITESVILYNVPNAEKWGDVKDVFLAYGDRFLELDIEREDVDYDEVYHKLYNEASSLDTIPLIKQRFNQIKEECVINNNRTPPPVKVPSYSGGGGGGGIVSTPKPPKKEEKEEIQNNEEVSFPFSDVDETHWGFESIREAYFNKLVNGISEDEFLPDGNVKREEFTAMLMRIACIEGIANNNHFNDVQTDDWFFNTVNLAYEKGIILGKPNGDFGAGEHITRQDIAVMINNMVEKGMINLESEFSCDFKDAKDISDYAFTAVSKMCGAGIFNGYEDNSIRPKNTTTRAEAACIALRINKIIKD